MNFEIFLEICWVLLVFNVKDLHWSSLTLKWPRYFSPVGAQGGGGRSMESPQRKPLSQKNFVMNATLYIYTLNRIIFNQKNDLPFQNASQITDFASRHFDFGENLKNHFPKGICQWNFAHNRRLWIHFNTLLKWKLEFLLLWDFRGKTIFRWPPNANLC